MPGSKYKETREDLISRIKNGLVEISEELDEGRCYLCRRTIEKGFLLEYNEEIKGIESTVGLPVHKKCYRSIKNPNLRSIK